MGKRSRNKGYRGEYQLMCLLRQHGLNVKRIPLSGSADFIKADLLIEGFTAEVKVRKNGFREIYKWIEGKDLLFIKSDRNEYLCVMPVCRFIKIAKEGKHEKGNS